MAGTELLTVIPVMYNFLDLQKGSRNDIEMSSNWKHLVCNAYSLDVCITLLR